MGKGGTVLGIIGLLIGTGGLAFGVINWMNQPVVNTTIPSEPQWYRYNEAIFTPSPAGIYIPIPNISIIFELGEPMSLHLLFTCSVKGLGDASSFSDLLFYFMINNVRQVDMPWARVGSFQSNTNYEYYTVSLQHHIDMMNPGIYNITVAVLSERVGNFIRESSFWIHAYTP